MAIFCHGIALNLILPGNCFLNTLSQIEICTTSNSICILQRYGIQFIFQKVSFLALIKSFFFKLYFTGRPSFMIHKYVSKIVNFGKFIKAFFNKGKCTGKHCITSKSAVHNKHQTPSFNIVMSQIVINTTVLNSLVLIAANFQDHFNIFKCSEAQLVIACLPTLI